MCLACEMDALWFAEVQEQIRRDANTSGNTPDEGTSSASAVAVSAFNDAASSPLPGREKSAASEAGGDVKPSGDGAIAAVPYFDAASTSYGLFRDPIPESAAGRGFAPQRGEVKRGRFSCEETPPE